MDEMDVLHEAFGPDLEPRAAAEHRARAALDHRVGTMTKHRRTRAITIGVAVTAAAAAIAAVAITHARGDDHAKQPAAVQSAPATPNKRTLPYARPVNAAEYLENAAWTAEGKPWTDPRPDQFMYIESLQLHNKASYENEHPNDPIVPSLAENRKVQSWNSVDGMTTASYRNGKLVVEPTYPGIETRIPWHTIVAMDSPDKVHDDVKGDKGSFGIMLDGFIGQYVLPPNVQAAIFRYLARQPGMVVNSDAVNIDGRPAIGLARVLEGYLTEELLFDKHTYAFIGERMVAVKDHDTAHKGDVFVQNIYTKMIIVDHAGDTR